MRTPDIMPMLSSGAHRKPSRGACFMEFASFLAGEAWSDHPRCTHPVLGSLARDVNDHVGDEIRQRLLPLVADAVGANPTDERAGAWIAREAALVALAVGTPRRQGVAAVGLLHCERVLAHRNGHPPGHLSPVTADALALAWPAYEWARDFAAQVEPPDPEDFDRHAALSIASSSVQTVVESQICDGEAVAVELLTRTVAKVRSWTEAPFDDEVELARPEWLPTRAPQEPSKPARRTGRTPVLR